MWLTYMQIDAHFFGFQEIPNINSQEHLPEDDMTWVGVIYHLNLHCQKLSIFQTLFIRNFAGVTMELNSIWRFILTVYFQSESVI